MEITDRHRKILKGLICPYCGCDSEYVDSSCIYGKSYGMIYLCAKCDAYCGVHVGTDKALGRLANKELRYWKKQAHLYFDVLWKSGKMRRSKAYWWLSNELGIRKKYTHIGMFSVETCKRVVELSKEKIKVL